MLKKNTAIYKEEYLAELSNVINGRGMCLRTILLSLYLKKTSLQQGTTLIEAWGMYSFLRQWVGCREYCCTVIYCRAVARFQGNTVLLYSFHWKVSLTRVHWPIFQSYHELSQHYCCIEVINSKYEKINIHLFIKKFSRELLQWQMTLAYKPL